MKLHKTQMNITTKLTALIAVMSLGAAQGALVTEFIGGAAGTSTSVGGTHTIGDPTDGGDFWNGGDTGTYLHEDARVTGSFSAVVRVVGQSEAANGRWGKAGIMARDSLAVDSSSAMAQVAAGNDSRPGAANPVPLRLAGRNNNDGQGGFEIAIQDAGGVDIPNDVFNTDGSVNLTWLRLDYDDATGLFTAGSAPDVAGAPGTWSYSGTNGVADTDAGDGWLVGMAYSAHGDMSLAGGLEGTHEVTFDNFSVTLIPEPSSILLGLSALGFLSVRRKR